MEFNQTIIWVWTVEGEVLRIISQEDVMEGKSCSLALLTDFSYRGNFPLLSVPGDLQSSVPPLTATFNGANLHSHTPHGSAVHEQCFYIYWKLLN